MPEELGAAIGVVNQLIYSVLLRFVLFTYEVVLLLVLLFVWLVQFVCTFQLRTEFQKRSNIVTNFLSHLVTSHSHTNSYRLTDERKEVT